MKRSENMPEPPAVFCKVKDTDGMEKKIGIYFGWRNSKCFYVGRSTNIGNRIKAHHVITLEDEVSWLEMSNKDANINEGFYIWALEPECNGEIKAAKKAAYLEANPPPPLPEPTPFEWPVVTTEDLVQHMLAVETRGNEKMREAGIKWPVFIKSPYIKKKTKQAPTS